MNNAHINCHCSLDISQCKTLNELSMGNAHINLSMGNSQGRDMGLNCFTMEIVYWTTFIVSTLNGQWTSFNRLNSQWTIGHPLSGKAIKRKSFLKRQRWHYVQIFSRNRVFESVLPTTTPVPTVRAAYQCQQCSAACQCLQCVLPSVPTVRAAHQC